MFPKRGALAGLLTIGLLVFLLNYRTPVPASDADFMAGMPADPPSLFASADPSYGDAIAAVSAPIDGTGAGTSAPTTNATPADGQPGSTPGASSSTGPGSEATPPTPGSPTQPGQPSPTQPGPTQGGTATPAPITPGPVGSTPRPPSPTSAPTPKPVTAPPAAFSGSIVGSTINTKYGPMQVKVVWSAGKIVDVVTLQMTNRDSHSTALSQSACPILRSEALKAQSAAIAAVSGATYTSDGYKSSLQSAISKRP